MPKSRNVTKPLMATLSAVSMHHAQVALMTIALTMASTGLAQRSASSAAEIAHGLKRLERVGSVLYLAAHPDDENTRFIAWSAQGKGLDTAYLSLTRGGGGQNLIGSELARLLGYIRTQELLSARAIDGGRQFFSRAIDFGYSKSADEAERIWGRDAVLRDMVRVIREFRPDIIVCRFSPTRRSHGHHVASARLTLEAIRLAADKGYDLTSGLTPWSVTRVVENKPHWRMKKDTDVSGYIALDVGGYDPWRGMSYGELAGASRSMHKSQGFGSSQRKTKLTEYFEVLAGAPAKTDLFEGVNLSWDRIDGAEPVKDQVAKLRAAFDPTNPAALIPALAALDAALDALPTTAEPYKTRKRALVKNLIAAASGLWLDADAKEFRVVPGGELAVTVSALSRIPAGLTLNRVTVDHATGQNKRTPLSTGDVVSFETQIKPPEKSSLSMPYWLAGPATGALYHDDPAQQGAPIEPPPLHAHFELEANGRTFTYDVPVTYRWVDPVAGERTRRVLIEPPATITPKLDSQILRRPNTATVEWVLEAGPNPVTVEVLAPAASKRTKNGYSATPAKRTFTLQAGQETTVSFQIRANGEVGPADLTPRLIVDGKRVPSLARYAIDYPHIPRRRVLVPSSMRLAPVFLTIGKKRVGYIPGAGDRVPDALRQMGYEVTELPGAALDEADFDDFDVVVVGIRAFNTNDRLPPNHGRLMTWVRSGGRVLVQYNTNSRWRKLEHPVGPYPFTIGRARVTDETAEMVPNDRPDHPALTTPNRLTAQDYRGWVQERGLYFAVDWDKRYTPLYRIADPGEDALQGSTLIAKHGEGVFVYTGLSFFRQLPAGVPGAYRLFANLLAL